MESRPLDERLALLLGGVVAHDWPCYPDYQGGSGPAEANEHGKPIKRPMRGYDVENQTVVLREGKVWPLPRYSSTWEGAGLLIAAIEERHGVVTLRTMKDGVRGSFAMVSVLPTPYSAGFASYEAKGKSLPEALARAALEALGKGEG